MSPRRTGGKDLRRKIATRPERKTIVVFCEGIASEPDYINGLKRLSEVKGNTAINVEIDPDSGVPLTLVNLAIARSADREVDECWCVFDVEWPQHHPNLRQAISLAREHGIRLAISNPCFELWLALHFQDCTAHQNTDVAERHSRRLDGRSGKRIDAAKYMPLRGKAAERAAALAQRHERDETECPHDNPSSGMYELLAAIEPKAQTSTTNR
ncbi:RloB family protein [Actinosynnema sp. NPDC047251]|uniref:RloB-like protein n=1 Tax=Saccharothrix espanaensis (strain ATCC 51144 / DSM 44229 / JCM 9112 / NBRC 15066 / NRRL 15764) TaxID=1179773 RepID=K0KDV0_SACES|nr:RloB family protein [Saccharothrix espanaensis]CCH35747.1 hypothetical protein BN6_85330 [Saccharothrix espanaensis DSM 44229]